MTPLQKIKQGILTDNIALIAEGYNALTSDKVEVQTGRQFEEDRFVAPRRRRSMDYHLDDDITLDGDDRFSGSKAGEQETRVEPFQVKRRVNLWGDDRTESTPEYSRRDRELDEQNRTAQRASRPPKAYEPVNVVCNACGRRYAVNPSYVTNGGYRCDRCNSR